MGEDAIETIVVRDVIRLGQFVKYANLVESGAMARDYIQAGMVKVDSQIETRRGRQLHGGEIVECGGQTVRVVCGDRKSDSI